MPRLLPWAAALLAVALPAGERARAADGRVCGPQPWPAWESYLQRFVTDDGRVIDRSDGDKTTSEGQAYALFFSLVADDRPQFDALLGWTQLNLAGGDLGARLPAWKWGRDPAGDWRVLDANAAGDADLWMAFVLVEAARLWSEPRYAVLAERLAQRIAAEEVAELPGLGPMLLPGPQGFALDGGRWRLNPSYLPLFVLRRLHSAGVTGPWRAMADATVALVRGAAAGGFVPDWVLYDARTGVGVDPVTKGVGSYDAIRTYLWAGLLSDDDEHKATLSVRLDGMFRHWVETGTLPERVTGGAPEPGSASAPVGFHGALLPVARERGGPEALARLQAVLAAAQRDGLWGSPPAYYDQNLILFGEGFVSGRYRFLADGRLQPEWAERCHRP